MPALATKSIKDIDGDTITVRAYEDTMIVVVVQEGDMAAVRLDAKGVAALRDAVVEMADILGV